MAEYDIVENFFFEPEITQLINFMLNNVYSKKDIFLPELIYNSSKALDQIRCESLDDPSKLESNKDLHIKIIPNAEQNTLTIIDTYVPYYHHIK